MGVMVSTRGGRSFWPSFPRFSSPYPSFPAKRLLTADAGVSGGQHHQRADREEGEQPRQGRTVRLPGHHGDCAADPHHVAVRTAVGECDVHSLAESHASGRCSMRLGVGAVRDRGRVQALRLIQRTLHQGDGDAHSRHCVGGAIVARE